MADKKQTLEELTVQMVHKYAAFLEKSASLWEREKATQAAVAAEIPGVVEALTKNNLIAHSEKQAAEAALQDPQQTLKLLKEAANRREVSHEPPATSVPRQRSSGGPANGRAAVDRRIAKANEVLLS